MSKGMYAKFLHRQLVERRKYLRSALSKHAWVLARTAKHLGMRPTSLRSAIVCVGLGDEYREKNSGRGRPPGPPGGQKK